MIVSATPPSAIALGPPDQWPWRWPLAVPPVFDPGPGRRSGEGSVTVRPYVLKLLAGKLRPEDCPAQFS
jgi:hypothetical protein